MNKWKYLTSLILMIIIICVSNTPTVGQGVVEPQMLKSGGATVSQGLKWSGLRWKPTDACLDPTLYTGSDIGAQINSAAATITSGCIEIPPGTYSGIATPIDFGTKLILLKGTQPGTRLDFTTGLTGPAIKFNQGGQSAVNISRFGVSDLTITNASTTQDTIQLNGIQTTPTAVHNVFISGGLRGISVLNCNQIGLVNITIRDIVPGGDGIFVDITTSGGVTLDNVLLVTPLAGANSGVHVVVTTNSGAIGGIYLNRVQALGAWANGFKIENTSGFRNSIFAFCNLCVTDSLYTSDAFLTKNVSNVTISNSWALNSTVTSTVAAWKFDNSSLIRLVGSNAYGAGQADVAIINSSTDIIISGTTFNGPVRALYLDPVNITTNLILSGNENTNPFVNDTTAYYKAITKFQEISPIRGRFSTALINDWQLSNIDIGSVNSDKYIRVNASGGLEILNNAHSQVILTVNDDGSMTYGNKTFATLPASANGSVIYCTDCNSTCTAGGGIGRTCFRENSAWTH